MIAGVLPLLKTLSDIMLLRKGPDAIPHSPLLLLVVGAIWLLVGLANVVLDDTYQNISFSVDLTLAAAALAAYAFVIMLAGHGERLVRAFSAILGCSAIFGIVLFVCGETLTTFLDDQQVRSVTTMLWLWSIPVEGHIISRTIDRHWYIGLLIAIVVFLLQLQLIAVIGPFEPPAP